MGRGPIALAGERRAALDAACRQANIECDVAGWDPDLVHNVYTYLRVFGDDATWCIVEDDDTGGRWFEWSA